MPDSKVLKLSAVVSVVLLTCGAYAAEPSPAADTHRPKMKMNEPMPSGMAKDGMMKGDVKSLADKKAKDMQPMMLQEEKAMPEKPKR